MRPRILVLALAAGVSVSSSAFAQQLPVYGCRQAMSCRNSPVAKSALNDPGVGGLLVTGHAQWTPGIHFRLAVPAPKEPAAEPDAAIEVRGFHLRNVRLLPPPEEPPAPPPSATPAAVPR